MLGDLSRSGRTLVLFSAAGPLVGGLAGVVYSLLATVPQLLWSPSSAGGTGSPGLTIVGALIGAIVGFVFGTAVSAVAVTVFAAAGWTRVRSSIRVLIAAVGAAGCSFVLVGALGGWRDVSVTLQALVFAIGTFGTFEVAGIGGRERPHDEG
ncbi:MULTISPECIES: hypothetical protein [unclassified Rathayibacter]|uniref:hypothetical protein n=1 Tax=unclassified Rathayibacter TaxID=2609250 RepID=UPI0011B035F1|nr:MULTISPECIES: hypothetical protein [unclassified Rathayibacter]